jgi:hypothetical protein
LVSSLFGELRNRHVAQEWNTYAINIEENIFSQANAWHYLSWFGAYYQTEEWWIYHCEKGWLYPESDNNLGAWLYWEKTNSWIWTRADVYPMAWDNGAQAWFNFCGDPLAQS